MLHTRLDTLETVDIASPAISPRVLYGIGYPSDIVRTSALYDYPSREGCRNIPYLRLSPSAKWAVRLIPIPEFGYGNNTRAAQLAYLSRRDGWSCFYCEQSLNEHTATVEHIVCTAHDGPDHADNLCLSCQSCNASVGSLPAVQKVKLAISVRVGRVAVAAFKDQQLRRSDSRKRGPK